MENIFKTNPAVFAVGNSYHIMVPVRSSTLMWVKVGDEEYFDDSNGVLRSDVSLHKMIVPMDKLNKEKRYTICYRKMIERKAYFSKTEDICTREYQFKPVENETVKAYQIADAHNMIDAPVNAVKRFEEKYGNIDFLILNGDVISDSQCVENFDNIYEIASQITCGEIPVVCSRGNHDTRGICAEKISEYTPCQNGKSYCSFKLGNVWGLVLDCGEDKNDDHPEYGNTMCCHSFRKQETAFIENLIKNADKEYLEKEVKHRIVIAHNPFTRRVKEPFNIESDIYKHWACMLKNDIKAELMISGHEHRLDLEYPGGEFDEYGHPCPVVVGSWIKHPKDSKQYEYTYVGSGFVFKNDSVKVVFNDDAGTFYDERIVEL